MLWRMALPDEPVSHRAWPDGDLVGFDLETTGPDPLVDVPVQYALVWRRGGAMRVDESLVDPGRPIPAGAVAVHGITDEQAAAGRPVEEAVRDIASALVEASTAGIPLVGMNVVFDLTMVDATLRRLGDDGLPERGWSGPVLDLRVLDRHVDRYRRGGRRLVDLCAHYGVAGRGGPHDATSDVYAAVRCVLAIAAAREELAACPPEDLHDRQVAWYREQQQSLSEHFVRQGRPAIPEWQHAWPIWRGPGPV